MAVLTTREEIQASHSANAKRFAKILAEKVRKAKRSKKVDHSDSEDVIAMKVAQ